jgi:hypothetical protein
MPASSIRLPRRVLSQALRELSVVGKPAEPIEVPGNHNGGVDKADTYDAISVVVADQTFSPTQGIRCLRIEEIQSLRQTRQILQQEYRREPKQSPERFELQRQIQNAYDDEMVLKERLNIDFVPQHSPQQLISPQVLLMSKVFNVRANNVCRNNDVTFTVPLTNGNPVIYEGHELRQSDGLVFMALINLARDFRVGTLVSFDPSEMCIWLYQYYNGALRARLRDSIHRLQHALLKFPDFSVQLATRFTYPARGRWTVMLDPEIVTMFKHSRLIWMDLKTRNSLPEGLTTWLFAYIESQTKLIPQETALLHKLCGSGAVDNRTFNTLLSRAIKPLVTAGMLCPGWHIQNGVLHWKKTAAKTRLVGS